MITLDTNRIVPTHPGELLKEELIYRKISQKEFAMAMGMPYTMLNDILNAKRPVTESTAVLVESSLGIPAYILVKMQADYNLYNARRDAKLQARVEKVKRYDILRA